MSDRKAVIKNADMAEDMQQVGLLLLLLLLQQVGLFSTMLRSERLCIVGILLRAYYCGYESL